MRTVALIVGIVSLFCCVLVSPLAWLAEAQKPPDPEPRVDPATGFYLQLKRTDYWPWIISPYKTRSFQVKIGSCFECSDYVTVDFTPPPWDDKIVLSSKTTEPLPIGRWYATITSVAYDWQVYKRHYIFDVR